MPACFGIQHPMPSTEWHIGMKTPRPPQAESYQNAMLNEQGRHQLGETCRCWHRLTHYAVRDVLEQELGSGKAAELLYKAVIWRAPSLRNA